MKYTQLCSSVLLALALSACGGSDDDSSDSGSVIENPKPEQPKPEQPEQPETGAILLEEGFEKANALPAGWMTPSDNAGTASVKDGHLYIDGRAHSSNTTTVMLPEALQQQKNYRIDVEFTFENPINTGRWGSIIYRAAEATASPAYYPYYQFAIRSNATLSNGTEFARKNTDNSWDVQEKAPFTEKIDAAKSYKATVIVYGNRVQQYINGVLVQDAELADDRAQGGIGLSTAGLVMKVNHIKVVTQLKALPALARGTTVQQPNTLAAMAPTMIQNISQIDQLKTVRASQVYLRLDSQLNMLDAAGNKLSLKHYLSDSQRNTLPVLQLQDKATIAALKKLGETENLTDVAVISTDVELLRSARTEVPMLRSILDLRRETALRSTDLTAIANKTNQAMAKIVLLPPQMLSRENVSVLQRQLLTVWATSAGSTPQDAATTLVTGVNGILTEQPEVFNQILEKFPAYTLLRKPLVIAHRGVPSLEDENTLEGLQHSVRLGAEAIENDIYITKDDHLVIMHDATVDRTTDGKGNIEEMTLAEVKKLTTKGKGYKVPTLAEFFTELKQHRNVMHFVELKSPNEKIVPALKAEMQKYGVEDQVITISFDRNQIQRMKTTLPGISTGYLTGSVPNSNDLSRNVHKILMDTQNNSSTYNPAHSNVTVPLIEALKHRGVSIWPWTVNEENRFKMLYTTGTYGITTNYSQFATKYVTEMSTSNNAVVAMGQPLKLSANLTPRVGAVYTENANRYVVLSNSPAHQSNADGTVSFSEKGTAYVLPGYQYKIDDNYHYSIFAAPVKVTIQ